MVMPISSLVENTSFRHASSLVCHRGRHAVSTYQVLEELADGRAALVQWKLETGRTHQIRSAHPSR